MAANMSAFASNVHEVKVTPLDFAATGAPTIKTYHGLSIVVEGNIVGRINSWQPNGAYNRNGTHIYELHHNTFGVPVDYVPSVATGFTIAFARAEVWDQEIERTLGFTNVFNNLTDQTRPFIIQEYLFKGQDLYRVWQYSGCWFQEKNFDAFTSDGDGVHRVTGTIAYVSRIRVQ
jgi:hypothetical protein